MSQEVGSAWGGQTEFIEGRAESWDSAVEPGEPHPPGGFAARRGGCANYIISPRRAGPARRSSVSAPLT
ncbi:hypothetical protein RRF57_007800 [Xylaria bambusicola]|uniref:Uncharacterized protein n=1 Tax=Xylaria bambusicola TaxID=326684 RepID=A0AAN7USM2_9PEZI